MIKKLILKNYRVYDSLVMDFEELQVIKGRNGIGKTSIVEAIGFALFGSALQRGKAGSWIKEGKKDGSVTLFIDDYVITRSSNLAIVSDLKDNIIARNNVGITAWVEKEYGLTADLYKTSFYIGQKDIGAFAALGPLERTKRVEKLLRIDRLDEIKTLAKEKARGVQIALATYESKLDNSPYNSGLLDVAERDLAFDKKELKEKEKVYEDLLVKSGEYNQSIVAWKEKQKLLKEFTREVPDLEALEKQYTKMLERNAGVTSYNKLVREKAILVNKLSNVIILEKYFNYTTTQIMNHEKELNSYEILKNEYDKLKSSPVKHDVMKFAGRLSEMQKEYHLNIDIPESCPTCKQPWPEKPTVDLDKLMKKIHSAEETLHLVKLEQRAYEISLILVKPEKSRKFIDEAYIALEHKSSYLRLQELTDIGSHFQLEGTMKTDIVEARKMKVIANRLRELEKVTEPETIDLEPVKREIRELKNSLAGNTAVIRREEGYRTIQKEFSILRDDAYETLDNLKAFVKFIDKYRKAFGNNVIPLLEKNVSNIVSYLTEGKYETVKINPDYGVDNFEFYSGSEQDSINFALRLAIAQISKLGSFKTMLLDEIAASFDTEKEKLLMDILKQQSNQLIYITHGNL